MKRYRFIAFPALIAGIIAAVSCQGIDYSGDINGLDSRMDALEKRMDDLEKLCNTFNENIETVDALAAVLDGKELVTGISEIKEGGEVIGYEISFSESGTCKIYNGKDGADGKDGVSTTFKIENDKWYISQDGGKTWTEAGSSVGAAGKDGVSPKVKIMDNKWFISEDGGQNWVEAGSSVGAAGKDGISPMIKNEDGRWYTSADGGATWVDAGSSVGAPGKDAPVIGIVIGDDGAYYWTLDGELMRTADGSPFRAGGQNGLTPELKIENGYWYVRYGAGEWTQYGKATGADGADGTDGADGKDGTVWTIGDNGNWFCDGVDSGKPSRGANGESGADGDSMFTSVTSDGSSLTLVLASGGTIVVPVAADLSISFSTATTISTSAGSTMTISYTITSSTGSADIDVLPTSGLKAKVTENGLRGTITIVVTEGVDFEYDKVSVIVTNGGTTLLKKITFSQGGSIIVTDEHTTSLMTCKGGIANFNIAANVDYQITITSGGSTPSWIRHTATRAMTPYSLDFTVDANSGARRTAHITVWNPDIDDKAEFDVIQHGNTASFVVTSSGTAAKTPEINGSDLSGLIDWGDEIVEWSQAASKTYDSQGNHSAEYFVEGATGFSFANLSGLVNINLEDF